MIKNKNMYRNNQYKYSIQISGNEASFILHIFTEVIIYVRLPVLIIHEILKKQCY